MKVNCTFHEVENFFLFKSLMLGIIIGRCFFQFTVSPVTPFLFLLSRPAAVIPVGSHVRRDDSGFDVEDNLAASSGKRPCFGGSLVKNEMIYEGI